MLTKDAFEEGIRDDGTIDDTEVETYYCPLEAIIEDEREYLRIQGDNGATNVEIRVPFASLEANGWRRPDRLASGGEEMTDTPT